MGKYTEVENAFFIFDEQRLVGSGVWVAAFLLLARRNRWILLSATPGDSWLDYIPVFIANGFYKNRTDFVRRHVVFKQWSKYPQVDRFVDESILKSLRRRITVEMPYERKTRRHMEYVYCDWDREQYETIFRRRWNPWKSEPIRQIAEMFMLLRRSVNSHQSRLERIDELLKGHKRMIIFYNFDFELDDELNGKEWETVDHWFVIPKSLNVTVSVRKGR